MPQNTTICSKCSVIDLPQNASVHGTPNRENHRCPRPCVFISMQLVHFLVYDHALNTIVISPRPQLFSHRCLFTLQLHVPHVPAQQMTPAGAFLNITSPRLCLHFILIHSLGLLLQLPQPQMPDMFVWREPDRHARHSTLRQPARAVLELDMFLSVIFTHNGRFLNG